MNGRLLSLFKKWNAGDLLVPMSVQMVCFLGSAFDGTSFECDGVSRNGENPLQRRHGDGDGGGLNLG